jgi:general secretion pathway protein E
MLADEEPAPLSSALAIVSRLKILARLDIAERRLPQDGSIKLNLRGREVDFRVATIPSAHGETVVIRILDRETVRLDLAALGMGGPRTESLSRLLERPNGILLVTGPTGSGKSTTLYAALNRLNTAQRKIVTVEDPIEFKIDGLNQVQVKPDIGMDFARSLRAILRHDPDIVMVGEIRDGETARVAMQAALTGHLVLSTLHTNDAASASPRLLDMGIEPYLIASTLSAVLAQRLVRTLCPYCRQACDVPAAIAEQAAWRRQQGLEVVAFEPSGCAECRGTGYRGRIAISELLTVDDVVRKAILSRSDAAQLKAVAVDRGMETLYRNGVDAVLSGVTAYDEVLRVAQDCGT